MKKSILVMKRIMSVVLLLAMMVTTLPQIGAFAADDNFKEISKSGWKKLVTKEWTPDNGTGEKLFDGNTGLPTWQANGGNVGEYCGAMLPGPQKVNRVVYVGSPRYTPPKLGLYVTKDGAEWIRVASLVVGDTSTDSKEFTVDFATTTITGFQFRAEEYIDWWSAAELTLFYNPYIEEEVNYEDIKGHKYEDEINLVSVLGLVNGKSADEFGVDDYCTRLEFAEWMLKYVDIPVTNYNGEAVYLDVSPEHWAYDMVYTCLSAGIIRAAGANSKFRPDDEIIYAEAVSMLTAVLGYSAIADSEGGYPTGYFLVSTRNGLIKGMSAGRDDKLTKGELAHLIFNSLDVEPMRTTNIGSDGYEIGKDTATMLERFDVKKSKGIVQANDMTMLNNANGVSTGFVMINGEMFKAGGSGAEKFLGYTVDFWYSDEDGIDRIMFIKASESMDEPVRIDSENIGSGTTLSKIVYYDAETQKEKTINLSPRCNYIFNGVANPYTNEEDIKPENGSLEILDSDCDGMADVVKIESYISYLVTSASSLDRTIHEKHTGNIISLKNLSDDRVNVIDVATGQSLKLSEISSGNVISVAPDRMTTVNGKRVVDNENMSYITIYISRAEETGKIEKMMNRNAQTYYVVNGKEFTLANCIEEKENMLILGQSYNFKLDFMGNITDFTQEISGNQYGILMGVSPGEIFSNELTLKIFTQAGGVSLYTIKKNARLGDMRENADTIYNALASFMASCTTVPSLVLYHANVNNVIDFISLANNTAEVLTDEAREGHEVQLAYSGVYKFANGCFGNVFYTDSSTIGFSIGADSIGNLKLNDETVLKKRNAASGFGWNTGFQVWAYNLSDTYVPDVLCVMEASGGSYDTTGAMSVFKELYEIYDTATETARKVVSVYRKGQLVEYKVNEHSTFDFTDLNVGDVGFSMTNIDGEIISFDRRFSGNRNWDNAAAENVGADTVENSVRYAAGKVLKKIGNFIVVDVSKTTADGVYDGSETAIFSGIGNVCIKEDDEIWVSGASEISVGDKIFIRNCYAQPFDVVIYK